MNKTIYKQLDSRWSSKPYPTKSSTFGGNGCGCCACTHIAIEQTSKANWTPENLRKWMIEQGYAYAGQGTSWEGITGTLKHIGHKNVVRIYNDPMAEAWKELDKGNRMCVLLMSAGWGGKTSGKKVYWTSGGHYITATDYYKKGSKHYFYIKDSGGRNNDSATNKMTSDGFYCYEDSMYGVVSKLWIVEKISEEKKAYSGEYPDTTVTTKTTCKIGQATSDERGKTKGGKAGDQKGSELGISKYSYSSKSGAYNHWEYVARPILSTEAKQMVACMKGCCANDNIGYDQSPATGRKELYNALKKVNFVPSKITKKIETSCTPLVQACIAAAGITIQQGGQASNLRKALNASSCKSHFKIYTDSAYTSKSTKLKAGDILNSGKHTAMVVQGSSTTRKYLKNGDSGAEVKKLQKLLNWYGSYGLDTDGDFGAKTETAVNKFKKAVGLDADGKWTSECNTKAKEIKK